MVALGVACCAPKAALVPEQNFDAEIGGKKVALYTIKSGDITAQVTNFGGRVVSLFVPNRDGGLTDVVLGHNTLDEYINFDGERFVGCCVGPVANRIAKGQFSIDDQVYTLPTNNDANTLHGGYTGVDQLVWDVVAVSDDAITMKVVHPDGLEGFPGNTEIEMTYKICECGGLSISYSAVSDKKTPINLSHHAMFNIGGECMENVEDQVMWINADSYLPVDETMIPTGEIRPVEGTVFDFRKPKHIGQDISADDPQLGIGRGYDHNWCLNMTDPRCDEDAKDGCCGNCGLHTACIVKSPATGIVMEVLTDQPGIQFYSGNFFEGKGVCKNGRSMDFRHALALETQNYPDAVNQEGFPNSVFEPGQVYTHKCTYKFSVCKGDCCHKGGECKEGGCKEGACKGGCDHKDGCCDKK